jgi:hypothetical protein
VTPTDAEIDARHVMSDWRADADGYTRECQCGALREHVYFGQPARGGYGDTSAVAAAAAFATVLSVAGFVIAANWSPGAVNMGVGSGIAALVFWLLFIGLALS